MSANVSKTATPSCWSEAGYPCVSQDTCPVCSTSPKSASSIDRFKTNLICRLLAVVHDRAPVQLAIVLIRAGFAAGDVTFRTTNKGQTWTEIHRWPWENK